MISTFHKRTLWYVHFNRAKTRSNSKDVTVIMLIVWSIGGIAAIVNCQLVPRLNLTNIFYPKKNFFTNL